MRADARNPRAVIPSDSREDQYLHEFIFKTRNEFLRH